MDRITWQVHGFTATSLRGFHRTNEPSTILYGRLLADKVGQLAPCPASSPSRQPSTAIDHGSSDP